MKIQAVFLVLHATLVSALALQAPTLLSVEINTVNTATVIWRNNVVDYKGSVISRLTAGGDKWIPLDTVPQVKDIYRDPNPKGGLRACYRVSMLDAAGNQEFSDSLCAETNLFLAPPQIADVTYDTAARAILVSFLDSGNSDKGFRVYRGIKGDSLSLVGEITTDDSLKSGPVTYADRKNVKEFEYYTYRVEAYDGTGTRWSENADVFTFSFPSLRQPQPRSIKLGQKISATPMAFLLFPQNDGSWGLKSGDSLIIREDGSPDSVFSIIDISDPKDPEFKGHRRSKLHVLRNGITRGDRLFGIKWNDAGSSVLQYLKFADGDFKLIDQDTLPATNLYGFMMTSDTSFQMEADCELGPRCLSFYTFTDTSLTLQHKNSGYSTFILFAALPSKFIAPFDLTMFNYDQRDGNKLLRVEDLRFHPPRRSDFVIPASEWAGWKARFWQATLRSEPGWIFNYTWDGIGGEAQDFLLDTNSRLIYAMLKDRLNIFEYTDADVPTGILVRDRVQGHKESLPIPRAGVSSEGYDLNGRKLRVGKKPSPRKQSIKVRVFKGEP